MKFTAEQIAEKLGGTVQGNPRAEVWTFSKIEEATEGSLTFLANPKYTPHIYTTGASVVLVHRDFAPEYPVTTTLIRVENPYECLSVLLKMVAGILRPRPSGIEQPSYIGSGSAAPARGYIGAFAYIGRNVTLGEGVLVYPQCYVGDNVTIGKDTILYPVVRIYPGCKIGERCIIHSGAVIGADGFGFAPDAEGHYHKIEQIGIVEISDEVEIGANTTVDRATMGATRIGQGSKLDNLIQVAHNVEIGRHTVMAAQVGVAGSTKIGSGCMIGGQVGFAGHIHVGDRVNIGAQSGIPGNVPSDARLMGYPAVNASDFARTHVYIKRLANLFGRVAALEKKID